MKIHQVREWIELVTIALEIAEKTGSDYVDINHPDIAKRLDDHAREELERAIAEATNGN